MDSSANIRTRTGASTRVCQFGFILLTLFFLTLSLPSQAMRCGTRLVTTGDTKLEVEHKCGTPSLVEGSGVIETESEIKTAERLNQQLLLIGRQQHSRSQPVETWHYNCGANRFSRVLTFVGPFLKKIDTANRGFGNSGCKQSATPRTPDSAALLTDGPKLAGKNNSNRRVLDAAIEFRELHQQNLNATSHQSSTNTNVQRYQDDQGQWHYSTAP
ncbi:MAG: DUF2845 domain-containing protein [Immundisolibacteraceae bacterium]|nr:DUF2845 domain-containing protein [Immundisolibacteraceae bacterium]